MRNGKQYLSLLLALLLCLSAAPLTLASGEPEEEAAQEEIVEDVDEETAELSEKESAEPDEETPAQEDEAVEEEAEPSDESAEAEESGPTEDGGEINASEDIDIDAEEALEKEFELWTDGLSQNDAVNWLYQQEGRSNCDIDGNGKWCTDLATAYMNYCWLRTNGDSSDPWRLRNPYTTYMANNYDNTFAGNVNWSILARASTTPQPGDLFVSENDDLGKGYGHIGVVLDNYGGSTQAKILEMSGGTNPHIEEIIWGQSASYSAQHLIRFNYFTSSYPPAAPKISIGATNYTEQDTVTISWNAVQNAEYYQYYLTEFPSGYAYTTNTRSGSTTSTSITFKGSELKNGRFSFFLHAVNSAGWSSQSNWVRFNIYAADYLPVKTTVYDGHIYALYDYEMSWSFARDLCTAMGGHLVTINSQGESDFIVDLIQVGKKDAYWLGATSFVNDADAGDPFAWVTGEPFGFTNWLPGEPNRAGTLGERECFVEIRKSYGNKWNDVNNIRKANKGFIVEIEPSDSDITAQGSFEDSRYYIIDRNTTWTEAEAYCEMLGGHLVTLNSDEETAFIDKFIKQGTRGWYYFGAKKTGDAWTWLDGSAVSGLVWRYDWPHSYLMKYKKSLDYVALDNAYYPEEDIKYLGFLCEVPALPRPGDINGDGTVDLADLIRLMKYLTHQIDYVPGDADVNGDGAANAADLLRLMRYVNGELAAL